MKLPRQEMEILGEMNYPELNPMLPLTPFGATVDVSGESLL
jgi:hypothetical protein